MYQTISECDFKDAFRAYGRTDNFSFEALGLLFDYFENAEDETGEQIELDVIAICCEYEELDLDEINEAYDQAFEDLEEAADWLAGVTTVAGVTESSIVFVQF